MINVLILDDDKVALDISYSIISNYLKDKNISFNIDSFLLANEAIENNIENKHQLTILDIDMPDMNGIEVAKILLKQDFNISIMFLSQREDLVFDSLSVHPFAFVRKNKLFDDFYKSMNLYIETIYNNDNLDDVLTIKTKSEVHNVKINEILYVEGDRNYQKLHLKNGDILNVRTLMSTLEEKLLEFKFIRIHKGFIVNSLYIRSIEKKHVVLTNKEELPLSEKNKDEIMMKFLELTRDKTTMM